jgi:digeranylgeranylglycerophospholipid reductase
MVDSLKNNFDVVIVGAGPAGSSSAYFSKLFDIENSKKVLLMESLSREKFIRYHHMCGEAVSKYIEFDLPQIKISDFKKNTIQKIVETWGDETKIESKSPGYILDRSRFILELIDRFKKKGGNYLQGRLIKYSQEKETIKIRLQNGEILNTKYLIFATGPRKLDELKTFPNKNLFNNLLYQILIKDYPLDKNCIKFYYNEKYRENYKWIFPFGENVKIGVPFENKKELDRYKGYEIIRKDVKSVSCGILNNYYSGNILYIGDAAFQNNPLTKGGIRNAINAGKMAAEAIIKYENPSRYDKNWKNSKFFTKPYIETTKKLANMKNRELAYHSKPLRYYPFTIPFIYTKYRRYLPLYRTYLSSEKYGW